MQPVSGRFPIVTAAILVAMASSISARGDISDADRHEVIHLLEFIRTSECAIVRNGQRHDGESAYSHVMKKYEYFEDEIETPEDFIAYSASKSTISGEPYLVFCGNEQERRAQEWLLEELLEYRSKSNQS